MAKKFKTEPETARKNLSIVLSDIAKKERETTKKADQQLEEAADHAASVFTIWS